MDVNLGVSLSPNYFSLDEILASEIRIPCKTEVSLPKFGFLDPSLNKEALPIGSNLELPLWVAQAMAKRRYVSVTLPLKYQEIYREVLKADATVVDLNKMGPYFYQSALQLAALPHNDSEQLAEIIPNVLKLRLKKIADSYSHTTQLFMADEATQKQKGNIMKEASFDALERRIFNEAKLGSATMKQWMKTDTIFKNNN